MMEARREEKQNLRNLMTSPKTSQDIGMNDVDLHERDEMVPNSDPVELVCNKEIGTVNEKKGICNDSLSSEKTPKENHTAGKRLGELFEFLTNTEENKATGSAEKMKVSTPYVMEKTKVSTPYVMEKTKVSGPYVVRLKKESKPMVKPCYRKYSPDNSPEIEKAGKPARSVTSRKRCKESAKSDLENMNSKKRNITKASKLKGALLEEKEAVESAKQVDENETLPVMNSKKGNITKASKLKGKLLEEKEPLESAKQVDENETLPVMNELQEMEQKEEREKAERDLTESDRCFDDLCSNFGDSEFSREETLDVIVDYMFANLCTFFNLGK